MPVIEGIRLSRGYARGIVVNYGIAIDRRIEIPRRAIAERDIDAERLRLDDALLRSSRELDELGQADSTKGQHIESAELLTAHTMLATEVARLVRQHIGTEFVNVEQALHSVVSAFVEQMKGLPNEYLREREQDVRDVGRRMMRHLAGASLPLQTPLPENSIVVASELLPSEAVELARAGIVAIVTERGGTHSHTAILARSLGIPAVTGIRAATSLMPTGSELLVDGEAGHVVTTPTEAEEIHFTTRMSKYRQAREAEVDESSKPCVTRDGVEFVLLGNIGLPGDVDGVIQHDLAGVGLFRTEFLFLEANERPGFECQRAMYSQMASNLGNRPFTIRTFDLGADKVPPFLLADHLTDDPTLNLRGLRFSLDERQLLETQVRALTEVAQESDVRILFPMVIGIDDFSRAVAVIEQTMKESRLVRRPQIGAMIETPAALFALDEILELADFAAIGTNDLTQYLLVADRDLADLPDDCTAMHPAVLRAIKQIVVSAEKWDCPVCVCGEDAGDEAFACLLLGLGVTEFSMSPARAPSVRHALRHLNSEEAKQLADKALRSRTARQVRLVVQEYQAQQNATRSLTPVGEATPS